MVRSSTYSMITSVAIVAALAIIVDRSFSYVKECICWGCGFVCGLLSSHGIETRGIVGAAVGLGLLVGSKRRVFSEKIPLGGPTLR